MTTEADVRAALAEIVHPTWGMDLITLNMVREVRVSPEGIEVAMVMNCPGCPAGEATLAHARRRLQALGAGKVRLVLLPQVWRPPWETM